VARRRSDAKQLPDNATSKPPVRVLRRRRRGPSAGKPRGEGGPQERAPQAAERAQDFGAPPPPAAGARMSRAPRPAEPPPKNPNVFSYTYTIWKSS
jgi:hypothetical protein